MASRPITYLCSSGVLPLRAEYLRMSVLRCTTQKRTFSSHSQPSFTTFFYNNRHWHPNPVNPNLSQTANITHAISPAEPTLPTMSFSAYRPGEVLTPRRLLRIYTQLSKSRLTALVVLTAMSGVAISPLPTTVPILLATAVGTTLCAASANTLNQIQEIPFDAQMARTRSRPLVRRALSPLHATGFALATGIAGPALLWTTVNPTTAILGLANIVLYAGPYTWLKRRSIWNTWLGSVVGAIPPTMGWTACGGHLLPSTAHPIHVFLPSFLSSVPTPTLIDNPLSALALFMLLFSWQFPHFNSLSHIARESYAQAGYHMLSVISPKRNALVALRHALLLVPICSLLFPLSGLTTWSFAITSLAPNVLCTNAALAFWRTCGENEARILWQRCLWYLPVVLALMMVHKRGTDWTSVVGLGGSKEDTEAN